MQLTLWTYEGPPHVGAMRVATGMRGLHYVLHAPQGDTYADLLFTMIERNGTRPPVSYTSFQARDLGSDTAQLFKDAVRNAFERFQPQALATGRRSPALRPATARPSSSGCLYAAVSRDGAANAPSGSAPVAANAGTL